MSSVNVWAAETFNFSPIAAFRARTQNILVLRTTQSDTSARVFIPRNQGQRRIKEWSSGNSTAVVRRPFQSSYLSLTEWCRTYRHPINYIYELSYFIFSTKILDTIMQCWPSLIEKPVYFCPPVFRFNKFLMRIVSNWYFIIRLKINILCEYSKRRQIL